MRILITFSLLLTFCACEMEEQVYCKGSFKATNEVELTYYSSKYSNIKEGVGKDLEIQYRIDGEDLSINSPCKIRLSKHANILVNNTLSIKADQGIKIDKNVSLQAKTIEMISQGNILLEKLSSLKAESIDIDAAGEGVISTVQFGKNVKIHANALKVFATKRIRFHKDVYLNVLEHIVAEIQDSNHGFIHVAKGVRTSPEVLRLEAQKCKVHRKAKLNSKFKEGLCFGENPPEAKITASYTGTGPFQVVLDATGSLDNEDMVEYNWYLGSELLDTTLESTLSYELEEEGLFEFGVRVVDSDGLSDFISETLEIVAPDIPEGVFISGVNSIDLIRYTPYEEYFFYLKENTDGNVVVLDDVEISLLQPHEGLSINGNSLLVQSQKYYDSLPTSITLTAVVEGEEYTKTVELRRPTSKQIGIVPAGALTEFTVDNEDSKLNGAKLIFSEGQSIDYPIEVYETDLLGGEIVLNFNHEVIDQPLEYQIEQLPSHLARTVNQSNRSHRTIGTVNEILNSYESFGDKLRYQFCSTSPNVFYTKTEEASDLVPKEGGLFPVFYWNYHPTTAEEYMLNNESKFTQLVEENLGFFEGITFIVGIYESRAYAFVHPYLKNVIFVDIDSDMFHLSTSAVLGTLLHEKRHVEQFNLLGCHEEKIKKPLRDTFLESNAEFDILSGAAPLIFNRDLYAKETIYADWRNPERYLGLMSESLFSRGINPTSEYSYDIGMIWDHLSFFNVVMRIKQHSLFESPLRHSSSSLKSLLGTQKYFEFVGDLSSYTLFPNYFDSELSHYVAGLYGYHPSLIPEELYYQNGTEGTAQKIDYLKPYANELNLLNYSKLTSGMDDYTKDNLRFKFLVYPSENVSEVYGFENVHVSLMGKGGKLTRKKKVLWAGSGLEPQKYEFNLDFKDFDFNGEEVQVFLSNADAARTIPVYTTVIPEIEKTICYNGPSQLEVTYLSKEEGHLSDYSKDVHVTVSSGGCETFYLIYNVGYFYELLVNTSDPQAVGYASNWDEGYVYNARVTSSSPIGVTAEVKPIEPENGEPIPDDWEHYYVDLQVQTIAPNTILIH